VNSGQLLRELVYRAAGNQIHGLTQEVNDFFYTTGGPQVFRLRNFRDLQLAITVPSGALDAISYAPLPLSEEVNKPPCELRVSLTGDPGQVSLFSPVLWGPNLHWLSPDVSGNGGRIAPGAFRYFVLGGTYWVSMDTKADTTRSPQPREQRVECTGLRAEASFHF
jgi:hypothetical protein